jgi:zinc transport system ATP-binding protein
MPAIKVSNLSVKYEGFEIFRGISFTVEEGDYIALSGPNGSGKSTLVKAMLGLIEREDGNIWIFDKQIKDFDEWYKIGYVPQKLNINPFFPASVEEVVSMGLLSRYKLSLKFKKYDKKKVLDVLEMMGILDIKNKNINKISGGQFQRVIIARALVSEPDILILDEPTTALDPETREKFFDILSSINKERHVTIILITHDTGTVGKYANKLMYFDRKIVFFGTFDDFCKSESMSHYFGYGSQHIICHRH